MIGRKLQLFISEEKSLAESAQKYRCLYAKSYADYKRKVFVENAWAAVDRKMGFEEGKEFFLFLMYHEIQTKNLQDILQML